MASDKDFRLAIAPSRALETRERKSMAASSSIPAETISEPSANVRGIAQPNFGHQFRNGTTAASNT